MEYAVDDFALKVVVVIYPAHQRIILAVMSDGFSYFQITTAMIPGTERTVGSKLRLVLKSGPSETVPSIENLPADLLIVSTVTAQRGQPQTIGVGQIEEVSTVGLIRHWLAVIRRCNIVEIPIESVTGAPDADDPGAVEQVVVFSDQRVVPDQMAACSKKEFFAVI